MEKHYWKMIEDTQNRVKHALQVQELDADSPFYGGFYDKDEIVQAKYAIYKTAPMIAVYCNEDTNYYQDEELAKRIFLGLSYIRRVQHENGLFDYITCNFYSAPDTAFCIKKLIPVYEYLLQKTCTTTEEQIRTQVEDIIRKGAYGLLEGGFHTPNHRWAIASMLVKTGALFADGNLIKEAFRYLSEGIDCNQDGEFSEKSAGNYNRVNNDAMIILSEALGDSQYEQYAVRNLKMMLTYWEPDGSIFTANSTRFDKDHVIYPKDYYMEYLNMGIKYQIPEFLGMCNTIFDIVEEKGITSPDFLIWFMLHPQYRTYEYEARFQRADFVKFYEQSGILRAQQEEMTYTVMREKSNFLYVQTKTIKLAVKVAGSFCEHRAFRAENMHREPDGSIVLEQVMKGWYYLPFEQKPDTSDWWKMENEKRERKSGPDMAVSVRVKPVPQGLDVTVRTQGVEGAPWRIELAFSGISFLAGEHIMLPVTGSEILVMKDKEIKAYNEQECLTIGPGFGAHRFTEGKEDSEAKAVGCATVYFTDYTEFDHTIRIRLK